MTVVVRAIDMLTLTQAAITKIADIIAEDNNPDTKLRTFVQGGGCSGFSYGFALDQEQNEDDFIVEHTGVTVVIDAMSMEYLRGAEIDYRDDLRGSSFVISNPNAQTTCGCGSSFSI